MRPSGSGTTCSLSRMNAGDVGAEGFCAHVTTGDVGPGRSVLEGVLDLLADAIHGIVEDPLGQVGAKHQFSQRQEHDDRLFVASGYGTGCALFKLSTQDGTTTTKRVWLPS